LRILVAPILAPPACRSPHLTLVHVLDAVDLKWRSSNAFPPLKQGSLLLCSVVLREDCSLAWNCNCCPCYWRFCYWLCPFEFLSH
jgi:hypothetical protein